MQTQRKGNVPWFPSLAIGFSGLQSSIVLCWAGGSFVIQMKSIWVTVTMENRTHSKLLLYNLHSFMAFIRFWFDEWVCLSSYLSIQPAKTSAIYPLKIAFSWRVLHQAPKQKGGQNHCSELVKARSPKPAIAHRELDITSSALSTLANSLFKTCRGNISTFGSDQLIFQDPGWYCWSSETTWFDFWSTELNTEITEVKNKYGMIQKQVLLILNTSVPNDFSSFSSVSLCYKKVE